MEASPNGSPESKERLIHPPRLAGYWVLTNTDYIPEATGILVVRTWKRTTKEDSDYHVPPKD